MAETMVYMKAGALKAILQIHLTKKVSILTTFNTHCAWFRYLCMPFVAKISLDIFQMSMDIIIVQCTGVINIHNNVVIFRVSNEDHDANLINLWNVCLKEDLSSKKLELQRVRWHSLEQSTVLREWIHTPRRSRRLWKYTADKQAITTVIP